MRLFVAIELSGEGKEAILSVRERLSAAIARQGVRFVRPEKLHVTLAFLGNVEETSLGGLKSGLTELSSAAPFMLETGELGCFPDMRRPKVVWVGLAGSGDKLADLAAKVSDVARPFAPQVDEKPYSAHVTLARIKPGSKEIGRAIVQMGIQMPAARMAVESFALMESKPDGTYESLHRVQFGLGA